MLNQISPNLVDKNFWLSLITVFILWCLMLGKVMFMDLLCPKLLQSGNKLNAIFVLSIKIDLDFVIIRFLGLTKN